MSKAPSGPSSPVITSEQGRAIVDERYRIPAEVCAARRSVSRACNATRREEWVQKEVAERSPLFPTQGWTSSRGVTTVTNSTAKCSPLAGAAIEPERRLGPSSGRGRGAVLWDRRAEMADYVSLTMDATKETQWRRRQHSSD